MRKKEQGVLTVEATIVLMVFVMFVLFLYNFAGVYRAQNLVSHAAIESADAVALESYLREVAFESDPQEVVYLASKLGGSSTLDAGALESLRTADLPKLAKEKFVAAIAKNESEADTKLKKLGIKDGLSGISFSRCHADLDGDNVVVFVECTMALQFPVFGEREIRVTKAAKAKTFGEILYAVSTSSNNPEWGNTSGDNRVDYGAYVEISATPNFGYRFVKWDDGNTENPRRVLVTDVAKYKAIFEPTNMGINLYLKKNGSDTKYRWDEEQEYGTVSGYGNYTYMEPVTISATAKDHYGFIGWDDDGDGDVDSKENPRQIIVDETHNITAIYQADTYTITVKSNNNNYGSAKAFCGAASGTAITVEYRSKVKLVASAEPTYRLKRWSNNVGSTEQTVEVLGNAEYTAEFERDTCDVDFYVADKIYSKQVVVIGSSIEGSKGTTGAVMPADPKLDKQCFIGWCWNNKEFTEKTQISVTTGSIRVDAQFITPSITLSGGETDVNATSFTAQTNPEDTVVKWTSSNNSVASVNSQGKVQAKKPGTVTITAYIEVNGQRYEDSVSLRILETTYSLGYCMNMGSKTRYYTNEHQNLVRVYKYGVWFPGTNHHCYTLPNTQYASKGSYTESQLDALEARGKTCAGKAFCDGIRYKGWNKSDDMAYIIDNGSGEALYFIREKFGPGGFYIYSIEHKN